MDLAVQPNLVERTVFEAARQDDTIRPHYERQFAECYDYREGDQRDRAFAKLHERWFDDLGLRDLIAQLVSEFPHFRDQVGRLMVTQAPSPKTQTAELFGSPGQYTVVIAVAPAMLLDRPAFEYWARHEFMHIDDMLDPAFGYAADKRPAGVTTAARNLAQDRYAVLWAVSVDARLMQRGLVPTGVREKRQAEVQRAFAQHNAESPGYSFEHLWEQSMCCVPNHRRLLEWAEHGLGEFGVGSASTSGASDRPHLGGPCPLCGFPTFDWAEYSENEQVFEAVRRDFPEWTPARGLCGRCAEVYRGCADSAQVAQS